MAMWLRFGTAVDIPVGPFVDSVDGVTPETALSITQAEVRLKKGAGNWAQKNQVSTGTHEEEGWYEISLDTTDLNTVGPLMLAVYVTGALPVWREFLVVMPAVYDAWTGATDSLPVNVLRWNANFVNPLIAGRVDASVGAMAADVITAAATATDFSTEVNTGVLAVLGALADVAGSGDPTTARTLMSYAKQLVNTLEGTAGIPTYPAAAAPANGVSIAEILRRVYLDAGAAATSGGLLEQAVGSRADTPSTGDPNSTSNLVQMMKQVINTLEGTAGIPTYPAAVAPGNAVSLAEAIRQIYTEVQNLDGVTVPAIADAVWDEAIAGHLTAGSTGAALNGAGAAGDPWTTVLPGAYGAGTAGNIIGNIDDAVAAVQADTDNIQTRLPAALVSGRMNSNVDAWKDNGLLNSPSNGNILVDVVRWLGDIPYPLISGTVQAHTTFMGANVVTGAALDPTVGAEIADAVWDEPLAGHLTAGSTGAKLNSGSTGPTPPTAAEIADAVWDESNLAHTAAGSTGSSLFGTFDTVTSLAPDIADAVWDEAIAGHLTAGSTGAKLNASGASADPWLTPVPGAYAAGTAGNILGNNLNATVGSRATPAQVNTEVLDVLTVDTFIEPGQQAPPATASLLTKINYLYKFLRNRITSSETEIRVYGDDGTTVHHKAPHADAAGVYTRDEFVSGP